MLLLLLGCLGTESNQDFVVTTEDIGIQSKTPIDEPLILSKKITSTAKDITSVDGMVQIPEGFIALGPRNVEAVEGYALPQTSGITPNNGTGNNQRDAGGPPLPPNSQC